MLATITLTRQPHHRRHPVADDPRGRIRRADGAAHSPRSAARHRFSEDVRSRRPRPRRLVWSSRSSPRSSPTPPTSTVPPTRSRATGSGPRRSCSPPASSCPRPSRGPLKRAGSSCSSFSAPLPSQRVCSRWELDSSPHEQRHNDQPARTPTAARPDRTTVDDRRQRLTLRTRPKRLGPSRNPGPRRARVRSEPTVLERRRSGVPARLPC
jgi:hypothetical protein